MSKYAMNSKKATADIEDAVTKAIGQVVNTNLDLHSKMEYSYLIVRQKLDCLDEKYSHLSMGVSDTEVCEAVMTQLALRLGIVKEDHGLDLDYDIDTVEKTLENVGLVLLT